MNIDAIAAVLALVLRLVELLVVICIAGILLKWREEWKGDYEDGPDDPEREDIPTLKVVNE